MLIKDNSYIPSEDKDFFILLRIGLWQKVEEELSLCPDWSYIYTLACEQTVQGIVADGIGLYRKEHPDLNITQEENDKFLSASAQIVRRNFAINSLQSKVCKLLNEQEVKYVILKGQGIAQYYPKPNLRCSGDIDILCPEKHYPYAIDLLKKVADSYDLHEDNKQRNADFFFGELEIELHLDDFFHLGTAHMKHFADLREQMFQEGHLHSYNCNTLLREPQYKLELSTAGVPVALSEPTFDATYIFVHFVKHYYNEGLGLRQLCDWIMQMCANINAIDIIKLHENIHLFHLEKQWNKFLEFAVDYLGLNKAYLQRLKIEESSSILHSIDTLFTKPLSQEAIWNHCKKKGNFGHKEIEEKAASAQGQTNTFSKRLLNYFINMHTDFAEDMRFSLSLAIRNYFNAICFYSDIAKQKLHIK